jgi:CheY-like chemotaxis protein
LFDYQFSDGTGIELCYAIRRLEPLIPIIICSASARPHEPLEASHAGAQAYLTKPLDSELLERTLLKLLG